MIEKNVEISGENTESLYEFICRHNIAFDGLRLGQRFVNTYIEKPWPELFYQTKDTKSLEMIEDYLRDNQFSKTMPNPLKF